MLGLDLAGNPFIAAFQTIEKAVHWTAFSVDVRTNYGEGDSVLVVAHADVVPDAEDVAHTDVTPGAEAAPGVDVVAGADDVAGYRGRRPYRCRAGCRKVRR